MKRYIMYAIFGAIIVLAILIANLYGTTEKVESQVVGENNRYEIVPVDFYLSDTEHMRTVIRIDKKTGHTWFAEFIIVEASYTNISWTPIFERTKEQGGIFWEEERFYREIYLKNVTKKLEDMKREKANDIKAWNEDNKAKIKEAEKK